jgi:MoaA/NifB/PqqE/SkfB family radical SAM enzyme
MGASNAHLTSGPEPTPSWSSSPSLTGSGFHRRGHITGPGVHRCRFGNSVGAFGHTDLDVVTQAGEDVVRTWFLWYELTARCQLSCRHCYAESGPSGTHGAMRSADWVRVLDQATELGMRMVQFIGGEPTLYPDLAHVVDYAIQRGLAVEVFSNLVHVTDELWQVFGRPGVSLATSYYSDDPAQHAAVTGRPSYARTRANIAEAVRRGIPLRAGVIDLGDGQRSTRPAGKRRAAVRKHCGNGVAAISPNGVVWPCVFSRWLPIGNVCERELAEILTGRRAYLQPARASICRADGASVPTQLRPNLRAKPVYTGLCTGV